MEAHRSASMSGAAMPDPEQGLGGPALLSSGRGSAQAEALRAIPRASAVPESAAVPRAAHFLEPPGSDEGDKACKEADEMEFMPASGLCITWSCSCSASQRVFDSESGPQHIDRGVYDLSAVDLTYKVLPKSSCGGAAGEKVLLNGVSAEARHGEILAVVGPSGAGKTTFLDAVAGRIRASSLEGHILLNGRPVDSSFRRVSGYVMQDDQLFAMLTVRETLLFSARLRLPNSMSRAEKAARVEAAIQELGLTNCANTCVGNERVRGLSGGEKRRVSIGVDLIHDPAVLFLDEPTSGLDSSAALTVVQILRGLAEQRRRTIVLTIHQPSFRILELIHNFLVLSRGVAVYRGPYEKMAHYFRAFLQKGAGGEIQANGLEYALDVIETCQKDEAEHERLLAYALEHESTRQEMSLGAPVEAPGDEMPGPRYARGFLAELCVLLDRNMKNILRTRDLFLTRIVLFTLCGFIVGTIFYQAPQSARGVQDRVSFFAFVLMAYLFTSVDALPVFLEERQIYIRETSRGAYRTSSYVLASTIAFLPFLFILALVSCPAPYFLIGLAPTFNAYCAFVLASFLTLLVGNAFVMFVAGIVPNFATGVTVSTAIKAFFFLCSGFFIPMSRIPMYWIWLNWLSTFKYPLHMMMLNEFNTLSDVCWEHLDGDTGVCVLTSPQVLYSFEIYQDQLKQSFAVQALIMVAFFVAFRIGFFCLLKVHTASVRK